MNPVDEIKRAIASAAGLVDDKSTQIEEAFEATIQNDEGDTPPKFSVTLKVTLDTRKRVARKTLSFSSRCKVEDEEPFDDKDQIKMNLEGEP